MVQDNAGVTVNWDTKIATLADEIDGLDARLCQFKEFMRELTENRQHFTEDELTLATSHCSKLEEQCTTQRASLVAKLELYNNKILTLSETIHVRQNIIEKFEKNGAFTDSDEIFNTLAHNHGPT